MEKNLINAELLKRTQDIFHWAMLHYIQNDSARCYGKIIEKSGLEINTKLKLWLVDDELDSDEWHISMFGRTVFTILRRIHSVHIGGVHSLEDLFAFEKIITQLEQYKADWESGVAHTQKKEKEERDKVIKKINSPEAVDLGDKIKTIGGNFAESQGITNMIILALIAIYLIYIFIIL
jgi:hypothetical protein